MPVLRPLIGTDKEEAVELARRIDGGAGTLLNRLGTSGDLGRTRRLSAEDELEQE